MMIHQSVSKSELFISTHAGAELVQKQLKPISLFVHSEVLRSFYFRQFKFHILPPLYTASSIFVTKFKSLVLLRVCDKIKNTHNTSVNINDEHGLKSLTKRTPASDTSLVLISTFVHFRGKKSSLWAGNYLMKSDLC